jgi:hypothetical protein
VKYIRGAHWQQRHSRNNVVRHHNVIPANGGNPGKVTVHGETVSRNGEEMAESLEDKMDRAGQSRVKTSLWLDPRLG